MHEEVRRQIGVRLRESRKAARLSQEDVAKGLGIQRQSVSAWECGKAMPTSAEWYDLGMILGVSLDYLVYGIRTVPAGQSPLLAAILKRSEAVVA